MKISIFTFGVKNYVALAQGIQKVKDSLATINYEIDITVQETHNAFTSQEFVNDAVGHGVIVNPLDILALSNGVEDITCLIYDSTLITPQPTNPAHNPISKGNASPMQMSEQWYNDMPEVFAEFFLHEMSHALSYKLGVFDNTHLKYDNKWNGKFNSVSNIAYYLFLISSYKKEQSLIINLMKQMITALQKLLTLKSVATVPVVGNQALYTIAKNNIGNHLTLDDNVPPEIGCAECWSKIYSLSGGKLPVKGIAGTSELTAWFTASPLFEQITTPEVGATIISATGTGNGTVRGHVGILGIYGKMYPNDFGILSNNSTTGTLGEAWSFKDWNNHYTIGGGLQTKFFRLK
jgi:hypothetical protein